MGGNLGAIWELFGNYLGTMGFPRSGILAGWLTRGLAGWLVGWPPGRPVGCLNAFMRAARMKALQSCFQAFDLLAGDNQEIPDC